MGIVSPQSWTVQFAVYPNDSKGLSSAIPLNLSTTGSVSPSCPFKASFYSSVSFGSK